MSRLNLKKTIRKAMNFWFGAGLKCSNWYYNKIGVPRTLGTAFILFDEYLTPDERKNAVCVMENSNFGMTGQNKVWLAGNVMMKAVLQNDFELVRQARDTIVSEIIKGGAEGIKNDWSFHQHGPQQQFGNYGLAYIYTMSLFSGIFSNKSRFVGGLSDGNNGISVLSLRKDGLSADKFWFFADSVVLCLGAGIESDSILDVATSVEQCWNKGKIRIFRGAERLDFDNNHQYETTDLRILHNGTGYLFMQGGGKCMVDVSNVNGSWYDIMQMYPDSDVYGDVFSVYINHGNCPSDASYSYMVIPETDEVSLKSFDISSYCILENNSNVQALLHDNICWAAVRRPSKLQLSESVGVDFRTAGLYRIRMEDGIVESVIYSDPTQQLDAMSLMINDNIISSSLPDGDMKGTGIELLFDK